MRFLKEVCARHGLRANYIPENDAWVLHKRGYAVQNFTTKQFYEIPKRAREKFYRPLLKRGLAHNLGEKSLKKNLKVKTQLGQRVI